MMGIIMPETCWVNEKKYLYLWHLVGSFLSYINDARSHEPKVWKTKVLRLMIASIPWLQAALNFKISLPRSKEPTNWHKPDAEELTPHGHTVSFWGMFLILSSNLRLNFPTVPFLRGLPRKMFIFSKNWFISKNITLSVQTTRGRY